MFKKWRSSLYLKLFLSFLATCVLVFVGLAVFWNFYFTNLFYKDKKDLLELRANDIRTKLLVPFQEGTLSTREVRFTIRFLARTFNGEIWIVDKSGSIAISGNELEGSSIPKLLDDPFADALKGNSGFRIGTFPLPEPNNGELSGKNISILTYYAPVQLGNKPGALFLHVPVEQISEAISAARYGIGVPLLFSLIAVAFILYTLSRRMARPLQEMNAAALRLAEGDFASRVAVSTDDEIGQLAKSFNFMVDQLEQWDDTRQEFLANVSHELRSPLTALRGLIKGMLDGVIPSDQYGKYLKICDFEVQRLQRLVRDLLDLASIQNGTDVFRFENVDVREATESVAALLAEPARQKGVLFTAELPDTATPIVCALDTDRLSQILQNLVFNALQFTPPGGRVRIGLSRRDGMAEWVVEDTGIGMSEDDLRRIWDRFYKADVSRGERTEGTGLGLTIVKTLVHGMKGDIHVYSEIGKGTAFVVQFPIADE